MVLVCLSSERGQYRVDDDRGDLLLAPFYSARDSKRLAQRLADEHHEVVRLRISDQDGDQLLAFTPSPATRLW